MKPITFSYHAKYQLSYRGTTEEEILDTLRSTPWTKAKLGKLECRKDFVYNQDWNGKHYQTKQVRPIFAEEDKGIIVITVYVYYF